MEFPRALTSAERQIIEWLLPDDRVAYQPARAFALGSIVIGEGRWGSGDFLLAPTTSPIDKSLGMEPVLAYGEITFLNEVVTISIHKENVDGQMEMQLSGTPLELNEAVSKWTYSNWKPGGGSPNAETGGTIREVPLFNQAGAKQYVLAIWSKHHSLWLHHVSSAFNELMPVTGFFECVMRFKREHDALERSTTSTERREVIFTSKHFFERLNEFSDEELREGLLQYNREHPKFDASEIVIPETKKRSLVTRFLALLNLTSTKKR